MDEERPGGHEGEGVEREEPRLETGGNLYWGRWEKKEAALGTPSVHESCGCIFFFFKFQKGCQVNRAKAFGSGDRQVRKGRIRKNRPWIEPNKQRTLRRWKIKRARHEEERWWQDSHDPIISTECGIKAGLDPSFFQGSELWIWKKKREIPFTLPLFNAFFQTKKKK